MKHYDNLMKLMAAKPQNVRVELYDVDDNGLILFIGSQCIGLYNDGNITYKHNYHDLQEETALYKSVDDLLGRIRFA